MLSAEERTLELNHNADRWGCNNKRSTVFPSKDLGWKQTSEETIYNFINNFCKYKIKKANNQKRNLTKYISRHFFLTEKQTQKYQRCIQRLNIINYKRIQIKDSLTG